jgi:hypothetical protein
VFYAGTYWALLDEFSGEGEHSFEAGYQFAPGLGVSGAGTGTDQYDVRVTVRGDPRLELIAFGSRRLKASLVEGRETPAQGWVSRRYGHREPAPLLRVRMRAKAPALFATLLFPSAFFRGAARQAAVRRLEIGLEGLACEIRGEAWRDIVLFTPSLAETACQDFTVAAAFLRLRLDQAGTPQSVFGTGVRRIIHEGKVLFESPEPVPVLFTGAEELTQFPRN